MENVEVFTAEGKGRGLKATKEFCAADIIFAERAYSAVVFDRYGMWVVAFFPPGDLASATLSNSLLSKLRESSTAIYALPCVEQRAGGELLNSTEGSARCPAMA